MVDYMKTTSNAPDLYLNKFQLIEFDERPVKFFTVSLSEVIAQGKRLDAGVFDIDAKNIREKAAHGSYPSIYLGGSKGLIKHAYYPGRFKRHYCTSNEGEPFYMPSQLTDINPRAEKYISSLSNGDIDQLRLQPRTLLLTRSGIIGKVGYVSKTLAGKLFSDDVIRVTFKRQYDTEYVYTFLKSKAGRKILTTNGYGAVISHLEPDHLNEIPVPYAPEYLRRRISDLIVRSYQLRDKSNQVLNQASSLLIRELRLPPVADLHGPQFKENAGAENFIVHLSELAGRADASYHVPPVKAIHHHLQRHSRKVVSAGDPMISQDIFMPNRFKRVYVDEDYGVPFFGGKSIGELDPYDKKFLSLAQHEKQIKEQLTIHTDMILITCSGTIGNTALVPEHWNNWVMTNDIIRLIPKEGIKGYLSVWLASDYARKLMQSKAYGSVVSHIETENISSLPVPLLRRKEIQQEINQLALTASELRTQAYHLEQEALNIMNKEIIPV